MKSTAINPKGFGFAFGLTAAVFYVGCVITLAATPHHFDLEDLDANLSDGFRCHHDVYPSVVRRHYDCRFYNLWVREK